MLSRKQRISKQKDFDRIYRLGQQYPGFFLVLRIVKNSLDTSQFAVVVSKKIAKKAVDRNRMRRQITEIIKGRTKKIKSGFDVLIIVKKSLIGREHDEIKSELEIIFKKSGLYV